MPNVAFALLLALAGSLAIAAPSSVARLLIAGGGGEPPGSGELSVRCLLIPTPSDWTVHLLSYGLLLAVLASGVAGGRTFLVELRRTRRFVGRCLARRAGGCATLEGLAARVGLAGRVDLVIADEPRCFCYGLARPRVCLTTGLLATLSDAELEAVLRHEAYHARNYDPLRLILGRALVAAFFFVPVLRDLYAHYRLHVELVADTEAVRQMRGAQSLAAALDKLLDARSAGPSTLPGIAHGSTLEARIDSLLGEPVQPSLTKPAPRLALSILLVVLIASPALATVVAAERELLSALASAPHAAC